MTNLTAIERIVRLFNGLDAHAKAFVVRELTSTDAPSPTPPVTNRLLSNGVDRKKGQWSKGAKVGLAMRRYWAKMTPAQRQQETIRRLKLRRAHVAK